MSTTVEEALLGRRSCRAFRPDPVPRAQVERILDLAARSASNSNSQPWQVHVLTGAAKRALSADLLCAYDEGRRAAGEFAYQPGADQWLEPFRTRRRRFGEGLYRDALGLGPEDTEGRRDHHRRNYEFFGAPVGMILTVSKLPLQGALVDAGLFLQALMLAARGAGLHTCAQASLLDFHPVLRRHVRIPDDHVVVCGIALGYADEEHRLSTHRTTREPVSAFATFYDSADTKTRVTA
ncbi:MAG TPA: nitroreductase [Amycolatopsis sp.]|uniref:Nitroreductase n=1 Tax=Amycolatopsis nalaikhensis TaxID=715472 RepID=A0ABY8XJI2_9PSEU|nr:nitroreductase [Amycolatopsis sp. 2-2]WIV55785.1 nitroreductase [Amycolatopsis sp. 2-2]